MDRNPPANSETQGLIDRSAAARSCLTGEVRALRQRLDVPARIRGSLQHHPATWMISSLATGLAASLVWHRNPRPAAKPGRGIPAKLLGLAWTATRPLVKIWLGDQVKNWLAGQGLPSPANRLLARLSKTPKSL
ncbi:MAG: hypothetical protein WCJ14_06920 [Verrucomicrobiota bacterium]